IRNAKLIECCSLIFLIHVLNVSLAKETFAGLARTWSNGTLVSFALFFLDFTSALGYAVPIGMSNHSISIGSC
ncbi:MAG: hypothetical protein ACK5N9_09520, partial [Pirellula sp.]